mgnify:CR=1 FL=1
MIGNCYDDLKLQSIFIARLIKADIEKSLDYWMELEHDDIRAELEAFNLCKA